MNTLAASARSAAPSRAPNRWTHRLPLGFAVLALFGWLLWSVSARQALLLLVGVGLGKGYTAGVGMSIGTAFGRIAGVNAARAAVNQGALHGLA